MSRTMGSLLIDLRLNLNDFNRDIEAAKQRASVAGKAIEASLNIDINKSVANQYKATAGAFGKPLKPIVDDSSLTALNKHLDLKQKHWAEVRRDFEKPIKPDVMPIGQSKSAPGGLPQSVSVEVDTPKLSKSIESAIGDGFKSASGSNGLLDLISAPFRATSGILESVFRGATEGLGHEISKELGQGLASGIQDQMAPLVGDLGSLGKLIGGGIAGELMDTLADEIAAVAPTIREIVGEREIAVGSANVRAKRRKENTARTSQAQEQVGLEVDFLNRNAPAIKQEIATGRIQRQNLAEVDREISQKVQKVFERLGGKQLEDKIAEMNQDLEALGNELDDLSSLSSSGLSESEEQKVNKQIQRKAGEVQSLRDRRDSLEGTVKSTRKRASEPYQDEIDAAQEMDRRLRLKERSTQNMLRAYDDQPLIGRSKAQVATQAQKAEQSRKREQQRQQGLTPALYQSVAAEVAGESGVEIPKGALPILKKGDNFNYVPAQNAVTVPAKVFEEIGKGTVSIDDLEVLIHELRHAVQAGFGGAIQPLKPNEMIKATTQEKAQYGEFIEASTSTENGLDKKKLRQIETDAYLFAGRNKQRIFDNVSRQAATTKFEESVGVGGGKALLTSRQAINDATYRVDKYSELSKVDVSGEQEQARAKIIATRKSLEATIAQIGDMDVLDVDGIVAAQKSIEQQLTAAKAEIEATRDGFKALILSKPEAMRGKTSETLRTMSTRKAVRPLAQALGIDTKGMSKSQLIEAIAGQEDIQTSYDRTMKMSRDRAQQRVRSQEQRAAVAAAAGRGARSVVDAGQSAAQVVAQAVTSPQAQRLANRALGGAGNAIAAIGQSVPAQAMLQGGRSALALGGQVAQGGYKALQGVESVVLDAIPMGRTAKAVGQQFVLPAAGYMATTHMLPGGGAMAHGLHNMLGGAISPIAHGLGGGMAESAAQVITNSIPNIGGIQQALVGGVTELIGQASAGAASAMTTMAELAVGGRLVSMGVDRSVGATGKALGAVVQPLLLPVKPAQSALPGARGGQFTALPEPDFIEVEVVAKKAQLALSEAIDIVTPAIEVLGQEVGKSIKTIVDDIGDEVADAIAAPKGKRAKSARAISTQAVKVEAEGVPASAVSTIDKLIGDRSQKASKKIWDLYKQLQGQLKAGNMVKADDLFKEITQVSESALADIKKQADLLAEKGLIGKSENSRVYGSMGQVTRASNQAKTAMEKAQRAQAKMRSADDGALSGYSDLDATSPAQSTPIDPSLRSRRRLSVSRATPSQTGELAGFVELNNGIKSAIGRFTAKLNFDPGNSVTESLKQQFKDEGSYNRVQARSRRSSARYDRAVAQVERRAEAPLDVSALDTGAPETLKGRVAKIVEANGSLERIKMAIGGVIGKIGSIPGAASLGISSLLGFGAAATIIPVLMGIADASTKAALEMQRLDRVIAAGTGSSYKGKAAIAAIGKQADELGLNKRQALQGYAQFAGSTRDTALEGDTGLGIFKNVGQAMGAQGVGNEQQERVFTALSQMASKGVVSMEELRQQVGESLPGALSIAARSMGMTTMEFSKLVESGELLSSEFLPKFAQQLAAESSTGLAGSAGSAQASLTRLGNSITDLQTSIGESILPVQKIGADVLVGAIGALIPLLEMAAKSAIGMGVAFAGQAAIGFVSSGAAATLMAKGLAMIGPAIAKALAMLAPMLAKFVLMSVAIDAARAAFDALSVGLGGGTSKFQEFANTAAKSMNEYRDALKSATEAQKDLLSSLPDKPQDVKGEAVVDKIGLTGVGRFVGGLFGNAKGGGDFVRAIEEVPIKALGGTTTAQQSSYVRQIGMNNQLEGRSVAKLEVAKQLFSDSGEIAQLKLIDKELESIQSKKRALAVKDPTNFDAVKQLTDREQELTKKREKPSAAVGKLQQSVSQEIELYKSAIKELEQLAGNGEISRDEYVNKLERYKAAIQGAEQDQNKLNKALKDTATSVESFERAWSKIADRMEDAATAAKSVNDGQRVAIARRELAGGTQGSSDRSAELMVQAQLAAKIKNDQQAAQAMRTLLSTQGAETVRKNFGVTDQTGPAELKSLSDKATGPKEKAILARMGDLKRIEGELKSSEADLAEAQVAAQRRLKDLTKSVADFYRGIEQQAKESALNAKSASIDIRSNNAKSKIVGALRGFQDNYISEFADSLVSLIDSFNEPFKIAIEAQKQILQKSQQLGDTMRQGAELGKQLPTGNEGMGMDSTQPLQSSGQRIYGKQPTGLNQTIRVVRTGQKDQFGGEKLQAQRIMGGQVIDTVDAASGAPSNQRFEIAGKNRQGSGSLAPIPEGSYNLGTVQKGNFGGGLGKTWIDIRDSKSNSMAIGGTGRGDFGLHEDANRLAGSPGSAGCVVFYDAASTSKVADWVKGGARKLQVDWGLGTYSKGTQVQMPGASSGRSTPIGMSVGGLTARGMTQQPGRGAAVSGAAMAAGNDDSYFMRAIGYSEGNRTIDGGRTKSYARHWDNVGKRWGSGSVSDVHGRTGAQVYTHWNKVMAQDVDAASPRMKAAGLGGDRQVALNIADMSVQSPLALKATGGFIEKLPQLARALEGVVGLASRQKVIDEFKAESYRNPKTGRLQTSFSSKAALLHDQNRRGTALVEFMGRNDPQAALQGSAAPKPNPYVAPRGVMMPTTSMGVGQIAQAESQAGAYAGLGDRVKAATSMAGRTAFAENTQIMQSAAAQSALKRMEYERSQRKAQRQLTVGGRTMAKDSQGLSDQFDDLLAGIGPDTAQKGLGENLRKSKQTFRGYNESIRDAIELRESALMDARGLSKLIASGQIQGVDPSVAKSLDAQISPMEKQLQNLYATRKQVSAAEAKVIADYRDKYALDLKSRSAEVKSGLTAAQRQSATEEATLLKAQAEAPGIGPEKRDRNITRAASLDRYVAQDQAKSDFDRQKLELDKLQRDQPDAFKPGDFAVRVRLLNEKLARQLQSADVQFANATAGIKQGAADRSIEQAAAAMRQTIEGFNAQAQSLEVRAKALEASGDPLGAFDVRKEAAQVKFQGDSASKSLELSQEIEKQEELVRANQRTREFADRAIAKLREQNGVSMANLTGELSNVTRELEKQKAAATAALEGRVREAEGQGQQLQIRKMTRTGRGMEAIGTQRDIDLNKIDFDLKARLRDLELDDSVPKEIKAKLRGLLTDNAGLESEEVSFNAKIALEDNQAQRRSLGAQSEMSILNAQASLAKTYGNDSSDYERQSAIIGENERFAESLRSIDAQARQMGLGAEEILKLKEAAGQLNGLNLENISAQFNPMVEAMNGVKGAFQGFLGDVISGNESIGDAFSKMVGNVGNMLAQLAAKLITQQLFSGLLGGLGGGGAAAGGGFLGGLFGFAEGGIVPEANHGPLRDRKDAIGSALRKEGPRSVLATLTPGEMVLTVQETRAYLNSSMRRSAQNGLAPTGRMRQAETIQGFKAGGIVPGGGPISITNGGSQSNINIPITINSAGGEQPSVNPRRLEDAVRAVVISEQRKAARPRSGR